MKNLIVFVVLAALSVSNYAAVIQENAAAAVQPTWNEIIVQDEAVKQNEDVPMGEVLLQGEEDTLDSKSQSQFFSRSFFAPAVQGASWSEEVTAGRGGIISNFRATHLGADQTATVRVVAGGLGQTFVTFRIQSQINRGYNLRIEVWDRW